MADAAKNVGGAGNANPLDFTAGDENEVVAEDDDGECDDKVNVDELLDDAVGSICCVGCVFMGAVNRGLGGRPRGAGTLATSLTGRTLKLNWRELATAVEEDDGDEVDLMSTT